MNKPLKYMNIIQQSVRTIEAIITHAPGGYAWWHSLPVEGYGTARSLRKRMQAALQSAALPQSLRTSMILAVLTEDGIPDPKGMHLYLWMVDHFYNGNAGQLHKEWLLLQEMAAYKPEYDGVFAE